MTENNEIKEMKYTEEQVMNALLQLEPEERELLLNGKFSDIMKLVNDDEIAKNVLYEWLTFARTYSNAVNGVLQL